MTDSTVIRADDLRGRVRDFLAEHPVDAPDPTVFLGARFDAGLAWIDRPVGRGGLGAAKQLQSLVESLFKEAGATPLDDMRNVIGIGMGGPVLLAYGTPEQQDRHLRPLWTGEEVFCQLFSEPGAGSDLANVAASAVRDGDGWRVNGQKVWTTLAHTSRWGLLLARTDPSLPKHQGITYFLCDMTSEGVDVRPLRQLTGEAEFNEVFLTDVHVPDTQRIGDVGQGWAVATTTLSNERLRMSGDPQPRDSGVIGHVLEAWRDGPRDPGLERDVVDLWVEAESVRLLGARLAQLATAGTPGPEGSGLKLRFSEFQQRATSVWMDVLGPDALLYQDWTMRRPTTDELGHRTAGQAYLRTRANTVEGGTSQIMRNIISERILGLPAEARADAGPWKDVPR
ncbi:MAG: acyl-CoA dehydrogenase family protein [Aeromicrobium sp.]